MRITKADLARAESDGVLKPGQADALWGALTMRSSEPTPFDAPHVAYYFGALIVIGAMGWYVTDGWEAFSGLELALVGAAYAMGFVLVGRRIWDRPGFRTPAGLLYTMAVCMVPLIVYGLERATGIWPQGDPGKYRDYHVWVKGSWLLIELGTILGGLATLRSRRFPFLTAPIAFSLWYMSMDLTPLLFGKQEYTFDERALVSALFGAAILLGAYLVDLRNRLAGDFAFWGYLFGLLAFWGGLSSMESTSELSKFLYLLVNIGLIGCSLVLKQRTFLVFGALGVCGYIGHLAYRVFRDSVAFPFVLSLAGVLVIYFGVLYQRRRGDIERLVLANLPGRLRDLVPTRVRALG
jgi:hypothetical protein